MDTDRRTNRRAAAEFEISYIHDGDYLISYSRDISVDGMFIYTENPPSIGEETTLSFSLEGADKFTVTAKVVWQNTSGDKRDNGIGVQFIDSPPHLKEVIKQIVNRIAVI